MTSQRMDPERGSQEYVEEYVETLVDAYFEIQEVWLFGSRANDAARADSDWDLLVWCNEDHLFDKLRYDKRFRRPGIDLFVVVGRSTSQPVGARALQPLPADDGEPKQLWLDNRPGGLKWHDLTSSEARYTETKDLAPGSVETVSRERSARLLYRGRVRLAVWRPDRNS